jgi:hypothetical protein
MNLRGERILLQLRHPRNSQKFLVKGTQGKRNLENAGPGNIKMDRPEMQCKDAELTKMQGQRVDVCAHGAGYLATRKAGNFL